MPPMARWRELVDYVEPSKQREFLTRNYETDEAVLQAQSRHTEDIERAVSILRKNLQWCVANLSNSHPSIILHKEELAKLLTNLGRFIEARDLDQQAYAMRKIIEGDSHACLATLGHLAYVLTQMNELKLAADEYQQLWIAQRRLFGESDRRTLQTAADLRSCLENRVMNRRQDIATEGVCQVAFHARDELSSLQRQDSSFSEPTASVNNNDWKRLHYPANQIRSEEEEEEGLSLSTAAGIQIRTLSQRSRSLSLPTTGRWKASLSSSPRRESPLGSENLSHGDLTEPDPKPGARLRAPEPVRASNSHESP